MIGSPSAPLPDPRLMPFDGFWIRFDASAPIHLRSGFLVGVIVISNLLPRLMGHAGGLRTLNAAHADRVVSRATALPGVGALAEIAKVVACMAYFSDPDVDEAIRHGVPADKGRP